MAPELEKARITKVQVRMDCNGCVQKIKKALRDINGIHDLQVNFPQQKLTVVGWADPEKIITAIRKTRKSATICTDSEAAESAPGRGAVPDSVNPPPTEAPPEERAPAAEQSKDPPTPENSATEATASTVITDATAEPTNNCKPKDDEEDQIIYHQPPEYTYGYVQSHGGRWNDGQIAPGFRLEPCPVHATHSYNTHKPSTYVTEYEYIQSPQEGINYGRIHHCSEDHYHNNNGDQNYGSLFSDDNPNACTIV